MVGRGTNQLEWTREAVNSWEGWGIVSQLKISWLTTEGSTALTTELLSQAAQASSWPDIHARLEVERMPGSQQYLPQPGCPFRLLLLLLLPCLCSLYIPWWLPISQTSGFLQPPVLLRHWSLAVWCQPLALTTSLLFAQGVTTQNPGVAQCQGWIPTVFLGKAYLASLYIEYSVNGAPWIWITLHCYSHWTWKWEILWNLSASQLREFFSPLHFWLGLLFQFGHCLFLLSSCNIPPCLSGSAKHSTNSPGQSGKLLTCFVT